MLGRAAVAMWWDVAPERQAEWEDWHSTEHMEERLAIPGFLRGTRWIDETSYFVLYETKDLKTITSGAYLDRLNNPSPWSRKMMPLHRNMVRSLCVVRERADGEALPPFMATIRFSSGPRKARGMSLLESQSMPQGQTTEQKIRGGDKSAGWIGLLGGEDAGVLAAAMNDLAAHGTIGVYRLSHSVTP